MTRLHGYEKHALQPRVGEDLLVCARGERKRVPLEPNLLAQRFTAQELEAPAFIALPGMDGPSERPFFIEKRPPEAESP